MFIEVSKLALVITGILGEGNNIYNNGYENHDVTKMAPLPNLSKPNIRHFKELEQALLSRYCELWQTIWDLISKATETDVDCWLYVYGAFLKMIYWAMVITLHRPLALALTGVNNGAALGSRSKIRHAIHGITGIVRDLSLLECTTYLPSDIVGILLSASTVHVLDLNLPQLFYLGIWD